MIHCSWSQVISFWNKRKEKNSNKRCCDFKIWIDLIFQHYSNLSYFLFYSIFLAGSLITKRNVKQLKTLLLHSILLLCKRLENTKITVTKPTQDFLKGFKYNIHHKCLLSTFCGLVAGLGASEPDRAFPELTELVTKNHTLMERMKLRSK